MSLLRTPVSRLAVSAAARTSGVRALSSSAVRNGGHGHDDHHHGHASDSSADTTESFFSPTWRNTIIVTTLVLLGYNFAPAPPSKPTSPSVDPEYSTYSTKDLPFVTKMLQQATPPAALWAERNEKHLELTMKAAEDKLLFQEAERPKIRRLRNPSMFENASPHHVGVGTTIPLNDLTVKSEPSLVTVEKEQRL